MDQNPKNKPTNEEVSDFNFKDFFKLCLTKWFWFLICAVFAVGIALFYIYRQQPKFERFEQILVNEQDSNGGMGDISNSFSTLGLFSKKTNVYNELITMTSPAIMYEVADTLQLDMNYLERDGLRYKTLYGSNLPFRVDMVDISSQGDGAFRMKVLPDGEKELFRFQRNVGGKKVKYKETVTMKPGQLVAETPLGKIVVKPNPSYIPTADSEEKEIRIYKLPMQSTVELYGKMLKGDLADQDADVIELSIEDVSVQRAVDILNYVLIIYNQNWIQDKNKMAVATSAFIDERLKVIESELGVVDRTIADYMKKTGTPDVETATRVNYEMGARVGQDLIEASNQLSVAKYMQEFLAKNNDINTLIPVNLGIENPELGTQILSYNEMLLNRNNVLNSSSLSNPLVQNYDRQLEYMRTSIERSVDNQVNALTEAVKNTQKEMGKMTSSLANSAEVNLPLLSEERQQEVKEALYLFLLQKREENELTQKFSADNIRVITPPVGSLSPVAPRKGLIIIVSLIIGFGVPLILIYFLESINTTVRNKDDLGILLMPFAGEIPQVGKKANLKELAEKNPLKKKKDEKPPLAVVEPGKRDVVNEAFRVVRGNLDFMSGKSTASQSIMVTSFNPGSGKSFVTYNLAVSFCLKNKKVLIIDCDLRHGSSSMYVGMPKKGLADYLTGSTNDWESLVVKSPANANLDILPIGKIPPNPAELLEDGRLGTIVEEAKKDYDIVFLDCPPVNIVVDTQIVAQWADRTLFIVRAGLLERSALKELNEFYEEKKFKNISVILNGTEAVHSRYYTYGNYQNLN
ncbi:MAG: polysaccharide biosynthesis tyrosine autokinase [Muribaculaceae bacterium]|nr:polysaccharide biosynthesis tyrosine autokinase [Muribaculaceae bacterium]